MSSEVEAFTALLLEGDVPPPVGSVVPFFTSKGEMVDGGDAVRSEQPWHRTLAHLLLQGYRNKDAAELLNKSPATVALVKREPWFQSLLAQIAQRSFDNDLSGYLEGCAISAVTTLETLAVSGNSETVRANAAGKLLDAFLKHAKPKEKKQDKIKDPQALEAELDREIEESERILNARKPLTEE